MNPLKARNLYLVLAAGALITLLAVISRSGFEQIQSVKHVNVQVQTSNRAFSPRREKPKAANRTLNYNQAKGFLARYKDLFDKTATSFGDPAIPESIDTWWKAAAMIEWFTHDKAYNCVNVQEFGNWKVCQDAPYTIKPPCLVYSFGINNDWSFDDDMGKLGCEVHSFDPSINKTDHKRSEQISFHNMGLGASNTDGFLARRDIYVKGDQYWRMRTLKAIRDMLGHSNRVIDVLKIDIEGSEWYVFDNMMETEQFEWVRQFKTEFHLFPNYPPRKDYIFFYQTYRKLREELGFHEYFLWPHTSLLDVQNGGYRIQGDSLYVNTMFSRESLDVQ